MMTPEEFLQKMTEIAKEGQDIEGDHSRADFLMCEVLISLGYGAGVAVFVSMDKWYA